MTTDYATPEDVRGVIDIHERHPNIAVDELWRAWGTFNGDPAHRIDALDRLAGRGRLAVGWQVAHHTRAREDARVLVLDLFRHAVPTAPLHYQTNRLRGEVVTRMTVASDAVEPPLAPFDLVAGHRPASLDPDLAHNVRHPGPRIGTIVGYHDDGRRVRAWARLDPANALADQMLAQYLFGYPLAVSTGFAHDGYAARVVDLDHGHIDRCRIAHVALVGRGGHPAARIVQLVTDVPAEHALITMSEDEQGRARADHNLVRNPAYLHTLDDTDRERIAKYHRLVAQQDAHDMWSQRHGLAPAHHTRTAAPGSVQWSAALGHVAAIR